MNPQGVVLGILQKRSKIKHNKRFKRDFQRVAFLLCVGFCGYSVMRKLGSGVGCPLTERYVTIVNIRNMNIMSLFNLMWLGLWKRN